MRRRIRAFGLPGVLALVVTALGLWLRVEHALTFDGPKRGSDYAVYVQGVRWMLEHKRAFHFDPSLSTAVSYQPPLWYATAAAVLALTDSERAIAGLSILGWLVRQLLLALFLRTAVPEARWSALAALSLYAVLPLSVLVDGKVMPEGMHATLFMAAIYVLWLIERRATSTASISPLLAVSFGLLAGLALLTKATASVLMIVAALLLVWLMARSAPRAGWLPTYRQLLRPALYALVMWTLVVSPWIVPNLAKYGRPFPHAWDTTELAFLSSLPVMKQPALCRRPLGWALPFDWAAYFESPVNQSEVEPRPNFWSYVVTGTWTDFYNRGFCRLKGGATIEKVWGAWSGSGWGVSERCFPIFRALLAVGLLITLGCVIAVFQALWSFLRSGGARGSLVLPASIALGTLFLMLFALTYPLDTHAVTNPRYLLPLQGLMLACAGMSLGRLEAGRYRGWALSVAFGAVTSIGALLVYERFG